MQIRRNWSERLFDYCNTAALIGLGAVTLYPLYYVFIVSISGGIAVARGDVQLLPTDLTLGSYRLILKDSYFLQSFYNTLKYTVIGTLINLSFSTLCAYPLSISSFSGRKFFTAMIVFTMFFTGGLIPTYLVVKGLGMLDTIWAIVLPTAISAWNMIIIRTFFQNTPSALRESAFMDGANDIHVLVRIILPLSLPVLATMTLFYSTSHWNSFFAELIYLTDRNKFPMQLYLRNLLISNQISEQYTDLQENANIIPTTLKYSAIIISTVPILVVYPAVQKYFVKGVMLGSLKG